jgi:hypothetical protein
LTEDQHRALAFIEAGNGQGYGPSADEVETWLREPASPPGLYNYVSLTMSAAMHGFSRGLVTDQLLRLRWVAGYSGELFTQPLGTALVLRLRVPVRTRAGCRRGENSTRHPPPGPLLPAAEPGGAVSLAML